MPVEVKELQLGIEHCICLSLSTNAGVVQLETIPTVLAMVVQQSMTVYVISSECFNVVGLTYLFLLHVTSLCHYTNRKASLLNIQG